MASRDIRDTTIYGCNSLYSRTLTSSKFKRRFKLNRSPGLSDVSKSKSKLVSPACLTLSSCFCICKTKTAALWIGCAEIKCADPINPSHSHHAVSWPLISLPVLDEIRLCEKRTEKAENKSDFSVLLNGWNGNFKTQLLRKDRKSKLAALTAPLLSVHGPAPALRGFDWWL